ncbi:hypothetical protein [Fodinicola acaciae]|uniref:hypothetical protein n=1 Tax=Fodinicola acaciae TaxID=2681555 RepID=UPI0013D387B7|nr:hypothetical protein [Fodinicola acaciae]
MLKRRMLRTVIVVGLVIATLLGSASVASASPTSFSARAVHGGGSGAIGVALTGALSWSNRSVALTSVRLYTGSYEQAYVQIFPWNGNTPVTSVYLPSSGGLYKNDAVAGWWNLYTIPVDGSDYYGGITEIEIRVGDYQHRIVGVAVCKRAASSCTSYQE